MEQLFESIRLFLANITTDQLVAMFIGVLALSCAVRFLKDTMSTVVSVIGLLAVLYFFAPDLYTQALQLINQGINWLVGVLG